MSVVLIIVHFYCEEVVLKVNILFYTLQLNYYKNVFILFIKQQIKLLFGF